MQHVSATNLARWFEQRLHDSVPLTLTSARLYGLTIVDADAVRPDAAQVPGAVLSSYIADDTDALRLAGGRHPHIGLCHDAVALVATGWVTSLDHELVALSSSPGRRKVRLVVVAGECGVGAVARRVDRPERSVPVPGRCLGPLAERLAALWIGGGDLRSASSCASRHHEVVRSGGHPA